MSRLIQITGSILALPEYGDERFCEDYDEFCMPEHEDNHTHCYLGIGLYGPRPRAEKPCPFLD